VKGTTARPDRDLRPSRAPGTASSIGRMALDRNGLEILSREECLRLLATVPVGRVAVSVGALPAILPVNFAVLGDDIVFRTAPGSKLDAAVRNAVVAFEADAYDPVYHTGWSVLVTGVAEEVTDPATVRAVGQLPLEPWALDGLADHVVRIRTEVISGRRIRVGMFGRAAAAAASAASAAASGAPGRGTEPPAGDGDGG
jgi:nitroimidazol reductase NimA-like FMN-containing flavoprotein (pyridoxamine 5'-phosphate oxidase superfamily)